VLVSFFLGIFGTFFAPFWFFDIWHHHHYYYQPSFALFGSRGVMMFIYWTLLEGYSGQSIGKMALNIKVTGKSGEKIDFLAAGIESFGKAFLLPIDCLIGWIAMSGTGQRLFNRLSNTIVVKAKFEGAPEGVRYVK
jgi:uncharacterized RDD family membrane protein YckC